MKKYIFILFVLAQRIATAQTILTGTASHIHDGDTFRLNTTNGPFIRVRLANIDAPELLQAFGKRSREFLDSVINKKQVKVQIVSTDHYGRKIGLVYIHDIEVNRMLVAQGLAWNYPKYSNDPALSVLESEARQKKIGLWRDFSPVAPWNFRQGKNHNRGI